ncbi:hypothetical protein ACFQJD_03280 [Haloplanus sp. GCM10025708]|uniref:DUF7344 domain-containing protein n=1 Tax=Haloferacaceae TaxID=1644056 RepID=UPI003614816A
MGAEQQTFDRIVGTGFSGEGDSLSTDELFEVLSNRRRRYTLHCLKQAEAKTLPLRDVAEQVAAWEFGKTVEGLPYDERKTVHTALRQLHLPKMDDVDIVDFDKQRGTVELTDKAAEANLYLEVVEGRGIPWSLYFTLFSACSGLFLFSIWQGVAPFGAIPKAAGVAAVVVAMLVSSVAFLVESRLHMRVGSAGPPPELDADN